MSMRRFCLVSFLIRCSGDNVEEEEEDEVDDEELEAEHRMLEEWKEEENMGRLEEGL